jgi:hypothetical protein
VRRPGQSGREVPLVKVEGSELGALGVAPIKLELNVS